ncbi:hypothetical protein [Sphingobium nicotianae]|nr:hypothetical protein [Sphingobium nicotianae]
MMEHCSKVARKSGKRLQFEHYLRTGQHLDLQMLPIATERKFNPYHDPRDGRFTFAPGGPRSLQHVIVSHNRGPRPASASIATTRRKPDILPTGKTESEASIGQAQSTSNSAKLTPANYRPNPRVRIGNNGGPPLNDPVTLQEVFPNFHKGPGGIIVAMADNILDLTGPAQNLSVALTEAHIDRLIADIQSMDPSYHFESLGFPQTLKGQINLIRHLRLERAAIMYRRRGDLRPLQVELLRFIQESTDKAYDEAIRDVRAGRIAFTQSHLWRNEMQSYKPYIPKNISEVMDLLSWMLLHSPKFEDKTGYFPDMNIETTFFALTEGLKMVRKRIGEETFERLASVTVQMKSYFEADPDDKIGEAIKGRDSIQEMEALLQASAKRTAR